MDLKKVSFIGGGRISWLLLKALQNKNAMPQSVVVTDPDESVLQKVKTISHDTISFSTNNTVALDADVIFLAVHPPVIKDILPELNGKIPAKAIVVSLMPVVKMVTLSKAFGCERIARMIPNAPSLLGGGFNPVAFSPAISESDKKDLKALFSHWGITPEVEENKLEAYAIVSAMGPTYLWFQWHELERLGEEFGLSRIDLKEAMPAMLHGAAATMYESGLSFEEISDLIPVHPMKSCYDAITGMYSDTLKQLHKKLTPNS